MSCSHLEKYLESKQNKLAIKNLLAAAIFPLNDAGFKLKSSLSCKKCSDKLCIMSDTMICGSCIFSGCLKSGHFQQHANEFNKHIICLSLDLGEIYCITCNDYKYNEYCDDLLQESRKNYLSMLGMLDLTWRPSIRDLPLLRWVRSPRSTDQFRPTRGLVNMGNTCFLNVVIQALTHTPALRDFLLSDQHRCLSAKASRDCLACELIRVAQQLYNTESQGGATFNSTSSSASGMPYVPYNNNTSNSSINSNTGNNYSPSVNQSAASNSSTHNNNYQQNGISQPLALTNLLYMIWSHVSDLARYDQHDAHELFLAVLSLLHTHLSSAKSSRDNLSNSNNASSSSPLVNGSSNSSGGDPNSTNNNAANKNNGKLSNSDPVNSYLDDNQCECIVHQAFMATLESKIVYDCGVHVSRHLEVFRDLSLEIFRLDVDNPTSTTTPHHHHHNNQSSSGGTGSGGGIVSLESSFKSYFGSERMRDAQCPTCGQLGANKQYSLFQLPNIFSVHLKRCHAKSKVNTKVHFPQELDLAPFISNKCSDHSLWEDKYSLYSVINHRGQHSAGHYTAYVRTQDNLWCLCDDQNIRQVNIHEVLSSDAYMLFYHKNSLVMKA